MLDNARALREVGLQALRSGDTKQAMLLIQQALGAAPDDALTHYYLGRVYDAQGDAASAVRAHGRAVALDPSLFVVRLHLAAALERAGVKDRAPIQYTRALHDAQLQGRWLNADTTAQAIRPLVEHAVQTVRETRRNLFSALLEPLQRDYGREALTRVERALRIYLGEEAAVYDDDRQRPTFFYFPGLPPAPYLDRSLFAWVDELEAQTPVIRRELEGLLQSTAGERVFTSDELERQNLRGVHTPPSWSGYYFFRHGERRTDNCRACPNTARALDALPLSQVRDHGPEVLFSVFTAGTHLLPHRGVTNTRLVGHLPLIVPAECALNVAGVVHAWREGSVVVFDDTYEHEAWNRSTEIRVVLIFDLWNPHLTDVERLAVGRLIEAIGDYRKAVEAA